MKGFDVLKVKSAVKQRNKFDLSRTHLTTMDFGEIVPLMVEETVPGDQFSVNADYFSRMAPLAKPTYGRFQFKTVAAFVPYYQVAEDADAWLAGKTSWEGITPVQRTFTAAELEKFVRLRCTGQSVNSAATYDYTLVFNSGSRAYYTLSPKGKYFVKILNSLGYALPQNVDYQSGTTWTTVDSKVKLSAYPLLAFFKLYNDYMSQSQRFNSSPLSAILTKIKYNMDYPGYSNGVLTEEALDEMFSSLYLNYENDYFTSAWQNPNAAVAGNIGEAITGLPASFLSAPNGVNADSFNIGTDQAYMTPGATQIGQRALDFLKDFDDWVRRNNYTGSRAVQQIYSRFGIKTDDYRTHYANVITTDSMPIQVGDVTATADASGVPLGDYAGKGIMSGSKGFNISVGDYGLVLVLGYFTVTPMNAFGFDRRVLRTNPLDYYTPEFDGTGAEAISVGEVWSSPIDIDGVSNNAIFGFTERYNSYRYGRDVITGDFRDYHKDGDMNCWHTGRNLESLRSGNTLVAQSTAMNTLPQAGSEYNRIFSVTDDS